jgi:hypothetical protein
MKPKLILVCVRAGPEGLLYGTSVDLRGLHVAAPSREDLITKTAQAIENLHGAAGQAVTARQVESPSEKVMIWVAVPSVVELDQCA